MAAMSKVSQKGKEGFCAFSSPLYLINKIVQRLPKDCPTHFTKIAMITKVSNEDEIIYFSSPLAFQMGESCMECDFSKREKILIIRIMFTFMLIT